MSVINQMLQELEQRRIDIGTSAAQVRAAKNPKREKSAKWFMLVLGVAAIAAALGYWISARQDTKLPAPLPVPVVAPLAEPQQQTEKELQVLQLAGKLSYSPPVTETSASQPEFRTQAAKKALSAPLPENSPSPVVEAPKSLPPAAINKEIKQTSPQQRAENAYRQAYASLQQGRVGEGEESLRQALQYDPHHAAARQALAALLVETKQFGRAEQLLQQGLELQPGYPGYAMTLARLQVERGDLATALATLQRNPPSGENAEYHGFMAALLQRSERHKEAIGQYQIALRSNPGAGPWLLGLGISLQADSQPAKAAEVFRRAKSSSSLSPELQAFAEQRLKQVQ